jgi:predicted O-methyltransferase YrrM
MRTIAHWTPRYVYDRILYMFYGRGHTDEPWLTPAAVRLLESLLRPTDRGAEFGSGRSTIWFAERVAAVTSVEHDEQWYEAISAKLKDRQLSNVDYILARPDQPDELADQSTYARTALGFPDGGLDFALVDGFYRDYTAKFILPKIKSGGMLIIDNVNWFLPSESRAPNSRTHTLGPNGKIWTEVAGELAQWRSIWTSSGVTDTAIFIRP